MVPQSPTIWEVLGGWYHKVQPFCYHWVLGGWYHKVQPICYHWVFSILWFCEHFFRFSISWYQDAGVADIRTPLRRCSSRSPCSPGALGSLRALRLFSLFRCFDNVELGLRIGDPLSDRIELGSDRGQAGAPPLPAVLEPRQPHRLGVRVRGGFGHGGATRGAGGRTLQPFRQARLVVRVTARRRGRTSPDRLVAHGTLHRFDARDESAERTWRLHNTNFRGTPLGSGCRRCRTFGGGIRMQALQNS